jgi:hypothetical protein
VWGVEQVGSASLKLAKGTSTTEVKVFDDVLNKEVRTHARTHARTHVVPIIHAQPALHGHLRTRACVSN